ncbi:phage tail tube protein [Silvibacterium acidisoli]|uniref:phage tail tube protein n=1 Tax=Acidobacteriaceae bacterium ZG23-2 TaxID=2883246 RepID=UPI00406CA523
MPTPVAQKLQGYKGQLQYTPSGGGAAALILGIKEIEIDIKSDKIDDTDHSTQGWKSSLPGLKEWSGTAKLDYITGDTSQQALRTAILTDEFMTLAFLPVVQTGSGIDEYTGTCIITDFKTSANNNDLQPIDISFSGRGALTLGVQ